MTAPVWMQQGPQNPGVWDFKFMPEQASTSASRVDGLYTFLVLLTAFFSILIATLIIRFAVRYRRRTTPRKPVQEHASYALEVAWIAIPLVLAMVIFGWGMSVYTELRTAPEGANEVYVVGKQWMWKLQHPTGQREINELHVPVGEPYKLVMTSEDVIHSFFIPAFRTKMDVLPGRFTSLWFQATKPGRYHLFCAEYCGTGHSRMIGTVHVMERAAYQEWLQGVAPGETMAQAGQRLYEQTGCANCHKAGPDARGPRMEGLFGSTVRLRGGGEAVVDETYLRESIVDPMAKVTEGWEPVMPAYSGQLTEEDIVKMIAYIKSLGGTGQKR